MQRLAAIIAIGIGLAACGQQTASVDVASGAEPDAKLMEQVDSTSPYAGAWALEQRLCGNDKEVWTIEAARMATPHLRFCAFENVMVNGSDNRTTRFATAANCLAEGHQTRDFLFFRIDHNLREMRVTFNDTDAVRLVRCPVAS